MRGRKPSFTIQLTASEVQEFQHWLRSTNLKRGLAKRARMLLLLHQGQTLKQTAQTTGMTQRNARKWARRFLAHGREGLFDLPGRGRKPVFSPLGGVASGQDRL